MGVFFLFKVPRVSEVFFFFFQKVVLLLSTFPVFLRGCRKVSVR